MAGEGAGIELAGVSDIALWICEAAADRSVVAVFSAADGMPTRTSVLHLARLLAASGRVIVIRLAGSDSMAEAVLAWPDQPGLTDAIDGNASFGRIIRRDGAPLVDVVNRGRPDLPTRDILDAPRFKVMLAALTRAYDHVLLDAGDAAGADTSRFAGIAPRCVLIVRDADQPETLAAFAQLTGAGFEDIAVMSGTVAVTDPSGREAA